MGTLGITHGGHEPNPLTRPSATLSPSDGERKMEFNSGVPGAALGLPRATIFSPSGALSLARFARTQNNTKGNGSWKV